MLDWLMRGVLATSAVLTLTALLAISARAQGGPPLLTDDPGTPGNKKWEVNFLASLVTAHDGWILESPNVDINYGLGDRIQLKVESPWLVMKEFGQVKNGMGNTLVGVKWRFLDEDRNGFDLSTYPQLEFNNSNRSVVLGLVDKGTSLILPIEAMKKVGPVDINVEVGYEIRRATDELIYGIAIGHHLTKRIEVVGELHGEVLRTLSGNELFLNGGSRVRIIKKNLLLLMAGRTLNTGRGTGSQYIAAFGIQLNF